MRRPYLHENEELLAGEKLRIERLRRGLTQSDMGEMMGLSTSYISSLERGQRRVSWNVGKKLHQCFGISYDYMMDTSTEPLMVHEPSCRYSKDLRSGNPGKAEKSFDQSPRDPAVFSSCKEAFLNLMDGCSEAELSICYQLCVSYLSSSRHTFIPDRSSVPGPDSSCQESSSDKVPSEKE